MFVPVASLDSRLGMFLKSLLVFRLSHLLLEMKQAAAAESGHDKNKGCMHTQDSPLADAPLLTLLKALSTQFPVPLLI